MSKQEAIVQAIVRGEDRGEIAERLGTSRGYVNLVANRQGLSVRPDWHRPTRSSRPRKVKASLVQLEMAYKVAGSHRAAGARFGLSGPGFRNALLRARREASA